MQRWSSTLALSLALTLAAGPLVAQGQVQDTTADSVAVPAAAPAPALAPVSASRPAAIRWWHGALVVGGVSALALLDQPTQRLVQNHRSTTSDHLANVVRPFGEVPVYLGITGGLLAIGAIGHHPNLERAGGGLITTFVLASAAAEGLKLTAGRARPSDSSFDADDFAPFSGHTSLPSGHTTLAFAFATELADDLHLPWATAGLYTLATAVGWSRLNDNRHWISDVGAGAAIGIISAKLADGRWRVFNIQPPRIGFGSQHLTVGWQRPF